ncbi:DoxX family protein [Flagellimonas halotolerans]|uniref:DoxX family membrane protein n=1 Tax=Flagellimonas halotolerans TaxID=3112164 RepID=A0ABU6IU50_9FLAO|nr:MULTISPECIES: DoxX family membrane protein [unclassified Allomuricauda]MEC3966750.1 DoxX family membrane protein [Muricauda sp. SYSU M86414]MEC4266601.1 DoxX family membrane protein [Muricauda sp. SYSU M84420]
MQNNKIEVNRSSVAVLRVMVSLIFIVASLNHLINTDKAVARIENAKFGALGHLLGLPEFSVIASGVVMLLAGIALAVGFKTKWSALLLILMLIPITLTIQVGQMATVGPLFKNIAILGGLLFFVLNPKLKKQ